VKIVRRAQKNQNVECRMLNVEFKSRSEIVIARSGETNEGDAAISILVSEIVIFYSMIPWRLYIRFRQGKPNSHVPDYCWNY
jgi:hypothetical protein